MKYLCILNSSFALALVLIVACFTFLLDSCCLAVAINDEGLLGLSVSLPFNDLLPPLSDVDFEKKEKTLSSINAASNVTPTNISETTRRSPAIPAPAVKPTKSLKSVQAKKLQQQKKKQQNAAITNLNVEKIVTTVKVPELIQAASVQQAQYQQQHSKPQKHYKQQQNQNEFVKYLQQQTVAQYKLQTKPLISQGQGQVSFEQLQQILHPTTSRPPRGALPKLTPFPRRL